jgi:hypothetical protein
MKRTKIALGVLIVLAFVAVVLQIFNQNTSEIETIYEIIAFLVAFTAVALALLQGMDNAKTTRRLEKLIHEMHELMKTEAKDRVRDMSLKKEIKKDLELDAQELKVLERYQNHESEETRS